MVIYIVGLYGYDSSTIVGVTADRSVAAGLLRKLRSQPFHQHHERPFIDHMELLESSALLKVRTIHSLWKEGERWAEDMTHASPEWTLGEYSNAEEGTDGDDYAWALTPARAEELLNQAAKEE